MRGNQPGIPNLARIARSITVSKTSTAQASLRFFFFKRHFSLLTRRHCGATLALVDRFHRSLLGPSRFAPVAGFLVSKALASVVVPGFPVYHRNNDQRE